MFVLSNLKSVTAFGAFYPRQYTKRSKKWSFVYIGPYTVIKKMSDLTYQIQKSKRDVDCPCGQVEAV